MIPKIIHYVWVGNQPKSKDIERCIRTWKNHLKDYKIMEWNEENFDINSHPFIKQAYDQKKWAFVSDYIRAKVIYEYGGIYLDTDVIVLDDLTQFLNFKAFVGFENPNYPFTAVFGAEKRHPLLKDMLNYFENIDFSFDLNNQMKNVNTKTVSEILVKKYGCVVNNQKQTLIEGIVVFPDNILCNPSIHSSTIHIFTGTWLENEKTFKRKVVTYFKLRLTTKKKASVYSKFVKL